MKKKKSNIRFSNLTYDDFRSLASDSSLSLNEKIGFPDSYRKGKEDIILQDIYSKLFVLGHDKKKMILDIGSGCSDLVVKLIHHCKKQEHKLHLIDSEEMLAQLDQKYKSVAQHSGYFPSMPEFNLKYKDSFDCILAYSIFHYVYYHDCIYKFIDSALSLLKTNGQLLIGDIPNQSKRHRFFSTTAGIKFHQKFTKSKTLPKIQTHDYAGTIDDSILFSIMHRYRNAGYETYILPQDPKLPMANRREDILIRRIH